MDVLSLARDDSIWLNSIFCVRSFTLSHVKYITRKPFFANAVPICFINSVLPLLGVERSKPTCTCAYKSNTVNADERETNCQNSTYPPFYTVSRRLIQPFHDRRDTLRTVKDEPFGRWNLSMHVKDDIFWMNLSKPHYGQQHTNQFIA